MTPAQKRERARQGRAALDAWVLNILAKVARESVPRGDEAAAFSAFLSHIAGDRYFSRSIPELAPKLRKVRR